MRTTAAHPSGEIPAVTDRAIDAGDIWRSLLIGAPPRA